jgi:hypothetical protein
MTMSLPRLFSTSVSILRTASFENESPPPKCWSPPCAMA